MKRGVSYLQQGGARDWGDVETCVHRAQCTGGQEDARSRLDLLDAIAGGEYLDGDLASARHRATIHETF